MNLRNNTLVLLEIPTKSVSFKEFPLDEQFDWRINFVIEKSIVNKKSSFCSG
jgi:hypothetical protein